MNLHVGHNKNVQFGTKAETLNSLFSILKSSVVPTLLYFAVQEWEKDSDSLLKTIKEHFGGGRVIIRSSAASEDTDLFTLAGMFTSILDIAAADVDALTDAIKSVIASYGKSGCGQKEKDHILIQSMVRDVSMSGVLFTQDMNTGAPYYVINYDDQSGRTDTVTSGDKIGNKTLLIHRSAAKDLHSPRFKALIQAAQEIEKVTGSDSLDIEFAVGRNNTVYLFQVRKITTSPNWNRGITLMVNDAVARVQDFVAERIRPVPGVYGNRSIFGQMPDWNPVEMIGAAPRPLAFSLYRHLITDSTWRIARQQMGYKMPKGMPLMVSLFGQPYVDVRLSFHSYLPEGLDDVICHKIVDVWLDRLAAHPEMHDKIEFDVAITVKDLNFDGLFDEIMGESLTDREKVLFREGLHNMTSRLLKGEVASIDGEMRKIEQLEERRNDLLQNNTNVSLQFVSSLLEDCKELGTLPFSIVARHGFIAQSFLRSLVTLGILDNSDSQRFLQSFKTIAGDMVADIASLNEEKVGFDRFIEKYRHLRPGTYDILSLRYDQRTNLFGEAIPYKKSEDQNRSFNLDKMTENEITQKLKEQGFEIDALALFRYIKKATVAREYAKFVFTKNISDSLEIIAAWGKQIGLSREELSYLTIQDIMDSSVAATGRTLEQYLRDKSKIGEDNHKVTLALHLPYLIKEIEDVSVIPLLHNSPNFITDKSVRNEYIFLDGHGERSPAEINGKIILIEGADPGFDWIFSCSIAGLITKYGGANSHMAIRCAEFCLPAAIGCGEQIFDRVLRSSAVEINCADEQIIPVEV